MSAIQRRISSSVLFSISGACLILAAFFTLIACVIVALYVMMRQITSSTQFFEGIPAYIVAIHVSLLRNLQASLYFPNYLTWLCYFISSIIWEISHINAVNVHCYFSF